MSKDEIHRLVGIMQKHVDALYARGELSDRLYADISDDLRDHLREPISPARLVILEYWAAREAKDGVSE